jgi:hypothetical protein
MAAKLEFRIIVSEAQRQFCNSFLHKPTSYAWLPSVIAVFDNIRDYTLIAEHVISCLRDSKWGCNVHIIEHFKTPDPLTLDMSRIPSDKIIV